MPQVSRRDTLLLGGGAIAALSLPACTGTPQTYPARPVTGPLLDVHAHLFNGKDVPVVTFVTRLFLRSYAEDTCNFPPDAGFRALGQIEDPEPFETLLQLLADLLLRATPTASQELAEITNRQLRSLSGERARVRNAMRDGLADFLSRPQDPSKSLRAKRENRLRDALWQEASPETKTDTPRALSPRQAAARLLVSRDKFGTFLRWIGLFFRSRQSLAQELVAASRSWGREPLMLVPLMVDYAHWLGQTTTDGSDFCDQAAVFGAITRHSDIPVHGMVAYDPLRAVFWTHGRHSRFETPEFDPLDLAETALTQHGFLGLKIYPPMGFRATGNPKANAAYPADAIKALRLRGDLGRELDRAMARAIDFCVRHDAPMIAHASNSIAAGSGYGHRAEPRFWIEALKTWPGLRLCLAHQGGFCWQETDPPAGTPPARSSWEWTIGRHVRDHPQSHLYMDISYFSELFGSEAELQRIAGQLSDWITHCDPEARHILYGTDWTMLGIDPDFPAYGCTVLRFLKDRCHLNDAQIERVMWQNAMRYLGLDHGKTRERLLAFYGDRRPAWTRIKLD